MVMMSEIVVPALFVITSQMCSAASAPGQCMCVKTIFILSGKNSLS